MDANGRLAGARIRFGSAWIVGSTTRLLRLVVSVMALVGASQAVSCLVHAEPGRPAEMPALSAKYAVYDAALLQAQQNPSDPKALTRFATIAVEIGDLEGAISALERLLLVTGDLPEVKLELGVLYFRLGSFETARAYLRSAAASPHATAQVKDRANQYLKARPKA